jgi:hypothetical protein
MQADQQLEYPEMIYSDCGRMGYVLVDDHKIEFYQDGTVSFEEFRAFTQDTCSAYSSNWFFTYDYNLPK